MNKLRLSLVAIALFSSGAMAEVYSGFGYSRLNVEHELSGSIRDGGSNAISLSVGYKLNDYLSFEGNVTAPLGTTTMGTVEDNYLIPAEQDTLPAISTKDVHEETFDMNYMGTVLLKVGLPLSKNFELYGDVGYTVADIEMSYFDLDSNWVDDRTGGSCNVYLSGKCGYQGAEILNSRVVQDDVLKGMTYGAGISFNYDNATSIRLGYRNTDLGEGFTIEQYMANFYYYF